MILIRYIFIIIIGYLLIRFFINLGKGGKSPSDIRQTEKRGKVHSKKVSKEIGEYIDYEEIKK